MKFNYAIRSKFSNARVVLLSRQILDQHENKIVFDMILPTHYLTLGTLAPQRIYVAANGCDRNKQTKSERASGRNIARPGNPFYALMRKRERVAFWQ
jgi:hypothetical protein